MLVKVSVENFKSFDKAAELTMISSNKIRTNANHRLKIKSTQLLKYAVVYGANASGKTNLALFFKFFKDSVCNGIPIEATQMFCKNRQENKERESSFEIQITVGDKFYAYGFSAVLSRRKVTGEWLYELYQNGSAKCLFEREGSKRPVLNDGITLTNTEKNKFETYADDFEGNETSLFLTEMNRGKKYSTRSKLLFFRDVYDWIQNHISIITPDTPLIDLEYYYDDNSLKLINKLIKTFDTGISQVKIEEITLDELSNALPKSVFDKMMQHVKNRMEEQEEPSFRMTMRSKETFFNIEVEGHSEPKVTTIRLHHNKSFYEFGFDEESDGTRRLFDLMDMLLNILQQIECFVCFFRISWKGCLVVGKKAAGYQCDEAVQPLLLQVNREVLSVSLFVGNERNQLAGCLSLLIGHHHQWSLFRKIECMCHIFPDTLRYILVGKT